MKLLREFKDLLQSLINDINMGESELTRLDIEYLTKEINCVCGKKKLYCSDIMEIYGLNSVRHIEDYIILGKIPQPHTDKDGIMFWYKKEVKGGK